MTVKKIRRALFVAACTAVLTGHSAYAGTVATSTLPLQVPAQATTPVTATTPAQVTAPAAVTAPVQATVPAAPIVVPTAPQTPATAGLPSTIPVPATTPAQPAIPSPSPLQLPSTVPVQPQVQSVGGVVYTAEQVARINSYFSNTVFAGDSVMVGFRNYCGRSQDPVMKQLKFLAAGSYSLHNGFWPVSSKSVHPMYMGAQHPLWEGVALTGANRAFLFFGINDMCYGVEDTLPLYVEMIGKIKQASPGVEINIVSTTYTAKGRGKGNLNNTNIAAFNNAMQGLCRQNGWGYVDIANPLSDGQGNLAASYCSDNYVHQTNSAYDVWRMVIYNYAAKKLGI